jgi:hypothetical protein
MRWSLHWCLPNSSVVHTLAGDSLDSVLDDAERKLETGVCLVGIDEANWPYLDAAQIQRILEARARGRSLTVARSKKKTTKRGHRAIPRG